MKSKKLTTIHLDLYSHNSIKGGLHQLNISFAFLANKAPKLRWVELNFVFIYANQIKPAKKKEM